MHYIQAAWVTINQNRSGTYTSVTLLKLIKLRKSTISPATSAHDYDLFYPRPTALFALIDQDLSFL
jgi:hypothetical protein